MKNSSPKQPDSSVLMLLPTPFTPEVSLIRTYSPFSPEGHLVLPQNTPQHGHLHVRFARNKSEMPPAASVNFPVLALM